MLFTISNSSQAQTNSNEKTLNTMVHLLNYAATHPDAKVRFHKSGMTLHAHSDGSCLSIAKARSRVAGFFFLADNDSKSLDSKPNGAMHIQSTILKTSCPPPLKPKSLMPLTTQNNLFLCDTLYDSLVTCNRQRPFKSTAQQQ